MGSDALLIADALALLGPLPAEFLTQDGYRIHVNAPSHAIRDEHLAETLSTLVDRGWLTRQVDHLNWTLYALTTESGRLWEAERAPLWQHYCRATGTVTQSPEKPGTLELHVYETRIGEEFARAAQQVGWLEMSGTAGNLDWHQSKGIRYWSDDDPAWYACASAREVRSLTNRELLHAFRARATWWNSLGEMQEFLRP
jgi:hypothetical protein